MSSRAPPPSSKPPVSKETVEVVRKKLAPPPGPPPSGMSNFVAPKALSNIKLTNSTNDRRSRDYDNEYDNDRENSRTGNRERRDSRDRPSSRNRNFQDDDEEDDAYFYQQDQRDDGFDQGYDSNDEYHNEQRYKPKTNSNNDHHPSRRQSESDDRPPLHPQDNNRNELTRQNDLRVSFAADNKPTGNNSRNQSRSASFDQPNDTKADSKTDNNVVTAPKKAVLYDFNPLLRSTYRALKAFVTTPLPKGVIARCYIERNRSGSNMLAPFYTLNADLEDGTGRELMVCRKVVQSFTSHYVFSLKADDLFRKREQRSRLYLGKLRSMSPQEYILYDDGICSAPDDPDEFYELMEGGKLPIDDVRNNMISKKMARDRQATEAKSTEVSLYRKELAIIHFNHKTRPSPAGTRGLEICIPTPAQDNMLSLTADSKGEGSTNNEALETKGIEGIQLAYNIQKPFEKIRQKGKQNELYSKTCMVLHEKSSRYDPLSSCLVDFKGRATMASVKNFQLVVSDPMNQYPPGPGAQEIMLKHDSDKEYILQMGKVHNFFYFHLILFSFI